SREHPAPRRRLRLPERRLRDARLRAHRRWSVCRVGCQPRGWHGRRLHRLRRLERGRVRGQAVDQRRQGCDPARLQRRRRHHQPHEEVLRTQGGVIEMFTKLLWAALGAAAGYYVAKTQLQEYYEQRLRKEAEDAQYFFKEKYETKLRLTLQAHEVQEAVETD